MARPGFAPVATLFRDNHFFIRMSKERELSSSCWSKSPLLLPRQRCEDMENFSASSEHPKPSSTRPFLSSRSQRRGLKPGIRRHDNQVALTRRVNARMQRLRDCHGGCGSRPADPTSVASLLANVGRGRHGCCAGNYFPSSTSDEVQPTPAVSNLSVAPRRDGRRAFFGLIASHRFPSPAHAPPQQASAFFVPPPPVKDGNGFVQHPSAKPSRRPSSPLTLPRVKLSASPRPHSTRRTPHLVI